MLALCVVVNFPPFSELCLLVLCLADNVFPSYEALMLALYVAVK
jgi:hypothetical protein